MIKKCLRKVDSDSTSEVLLYVDEVFPFQSLSEQQRKRLMKLTRPEPSSIMTQELIHHETKRNGTCVLAMDSKNAIQAWGMVNDHCLLQVFVNPKYRRTSHKYGSQIVIKLLRQSKETFLYFVPDGDNMQFWYALKSPYLIPVLRVGTKYACLYSRNIGILHLSEITHLTQFEPIAPTELENFEILSAWEDMLEKSLLINPAKNEKSTLSADTAQQ